MPKLPSVSGQEIIRALERLGFVDNVASAVPAKVAPKGAIQLRVETPDYEQMRADTFSVGEITLRVKQVSW